MHELYQEVPIDQVLPEELPREKNNDDNMNIPEIISIGI